MIPDHDAIVALHKKYAPNDAAFAMVFTHCEIVRRIAEQLLNVMPQPAIDAELVRAGCLLHDIGVYRLFVNGSMDRDRYITHGTEGERILKSENIDERLCRMASHHTGVGIRKADIIDQRLPLPHMDFTADSLEEQLVMYADKFHSKTPRFNTTESYAKFIAGYGRDKVATFMDMVDTFGKPDIELLAQEYGHPIV